MNIRQPQYMRRGSEPRRYVIRRMEGNRQAWQETARRKVGRINGREHDMLPVEAAAEGGEWQSRSTVANTTRQRHSTRSKRAWQARPGRGTGINAGVKASAGTDTHKRRYAVWKAEHASSS